MPNINKRASRIKEYKGFTMIEMVIVMGIAVILIALGMNSFSGFRNEMLLTQAVYNLTQDIKYAQRSSMFIKKDVNDKWLYGIGIDLQTYNSNKEYKVFKWCSQFDEYNPNGDARLTSELPNWNPQKAFNTNNNAKLSLTYGDCNKTGTVLNTTYLKEVTGYTTEKVDNSFVVTIDQINGKNPRFILFEAVSGRAFFYDSSRELLNYSYGGQNVVNIFPNPQSVVIKIEAPNGSIRKISIEPVSGRVKTE